jgi:hypothetical protein
MERSAGDLEVEPRHDERRHAIAGRIREPKIAEVNPHGTAHWKDFDPRSKKTPVF